MAFLPIMRLIVLIGTLVCAVIVVGLSAHFTWVTETAFVEYFISVALAIAASGLTILTVPVMIGIDCARRGAFTSMVLVELIWLLVLWVLWVAAAAFLAQDQNLLGTGVGCDFLNTEIQTACQEYNAIEAFSFLAWFLLMVYDITLLIYAIVGSTRGTSPWTSTVAEGLLTRNGTTVPDKQYMASTGGTYNSTAPSAQYPPQQQYAQYGQQPSRSPMV
ncbi:hypothetical protein GYMLUDRAFT_82852 [Collybiopsis luxurians FD-317 M1]|nr:hypothetical protein GYMLUDRAFT_82852 [Collybiopsis luxurians FD-317 M1]